MARQIIKNPPPVPPWLQALGEPAAQRLLAWGQAQADQCLSDVFGYHAVQAGWPGFDALQANRMPHRWQAQQEFDAPESVDVSADLCFDSRAWPWAAESLDLVALPHTLERSADPHACLREVERVLIPEGQVFILGIHPWGLWGHRLRRAQARQATEALAPWLLQPIAPHRLRDWLHLLGFEVQVQRFVGWTPAWLDGIGRRWLPFLGGAYLIVATKRVPGGRLLSGKAWRKVPSRSAVVVPAASIQAPVRASANTESPS